ncbi:RsfA family transcriptional regulator [Jeotgalibacillus campisalis]|uniref:Uncharacterized protein n=1 Tax=Jeotgalibacillus campisalis TaxID=220754 RepID=A0A0C2VFE3_9BACL|nr:RsfA family transcriptional regulator [Jeotgalibacillus campisalis]KIL47612.1 hypothetical protein KR50_17790 [Jeotgalibacillus campisalis]
MTKLRQDGWTEEEDRWLEDAVLSHIRNGSTQLRAFEEIAQKVNRTPAACGFRWNSCLRKECQQQIDQAKKERYASRKAATPAAPAAAVKTSLNWSAEEMTSQLANWIERISSHDHTVDWKEKYYKAEQSLENATREKEKLEMKIQGLEEDYRALLYLIEKARKLGVEEGKEEAYEAPVFKMEPNGNLFRLNRNPTRTEQNEAVDL